MTLSWDPLAGVDSYKIVYNLSNFGWSTIEVTDTFLTLTHESFGLAYFYIRANCSESYFSPYSDLLHIELPSCPSISIEASDTTFCFGESSTLAAIGAVSYTHLTLPTNIGV